MLERGQARREHLFHGAACKLEEGNTRDTRRDTHKHTHAHTEHFRYTHNTETNSLEGTQESAGDELSHRKASGRATHPLIRAACAREAHCAAHQHTDGAS